MNLNHTNNTNNNETTTQNSLKQKQTITTNLNNKENSSTYSLDSALEFVTENTLLPEEDEEQHGAMHKLIANSTATNTNTNTNTNNRDSGGTNSNNSLNDLNYLSDDDFSQVINLYRKRIRTSRPPKFQFDFN